MALRVVDCKSGHYIVLAIYNRARRCEGPSGIPVCDLPWSSRDNFFTLLRGSARNVQLEPQRDFRGGECVSTKGAVTAGERRRRRHLKQGRGQGRGAAYKPGLKTHEVPTTSVKHRPSSAIFQRTLQLLSDLEFQVFILFESIYHVTDCREQFPLDLEVTIAIAERYGIKHPLLKEELHEQTTDLLLTVVVDGQERHFAVFIKYAKALSAREAEKAFIQEMYWARQGIPLFIVTEKQLSKILVRNAARLRAKLDPGFLRVAADAEQFERVAAHLTQLVLRRHEPLDALGEECEASLGIPEPGTCVALARYLIANGYWRINLSDRVFDPLEPIEILSETVSEGGAIFAGSE